MIRNHLLSLVCFALVAGPMALSQQAPPPPAQPSTPPPPPRVNKVERRIVIHGPEDGGGAMGIVPPGTWWRNPETVKEVNLSPDQTKHMDEIFRQNRIELIHLKASLEEEQLNLEPLLNANPPDTNRALSEISKIADLRANLEKANAKMLLALRAVLTADQWTKLQSERHIHRLEIGPDGMRGFGKGFGEGKGFGPNSSFTMPEIHIPALDIPGKHFDARTIAGLDMKEMKIPEINIPAIDIPGKHIEARVVKGPDGEDIKIPAIDIPEVHIPAKHIAAHSLEGLKHDDIKIPEINIPEIHVPAVDIDGDDISTTEN
jgi:Spy/CpxP family protein refolding chaperone